MKRANHLLESILDPENLRLAFWKARKGRNYSSQVQAFREDLEDNLVDLREQIASGLVEVGQYRYFKVYDPKEREICASAFSEQVLHHALMNVCHDYFDRAQIFHSYACRKGKGTYAAIAAAKVFTRKYPWYLKLDVRKFFSSIHHAVLKAQLEQLFGEWGLLEIFGKIIDSYESSAETGMPIGNLTSQYFANHYLSGLDHFIKEQLHIKAYVRYMDDMVLWHEDKTALKMALTAIEEYVQNKLQCRLKPAILNQTKYGLTFLGYRIFPYQFKLSQRSKQRFIRKIGELEKHYHNGNWSEATCQRRILPLLAFTQHADAKKFRERVFLELSGQSS